MLGGGHRHQHLFSANDLSPLLSPGGILLSWRFLSNGERFFPDLKKNLPFIWRRNNDKWREFCYNKRMSEKQKAADQRSQYAGSTQSSPDHTLSGDKLSWISGAEKRPHRLAGAAGRAGGSVGRREDIKGCSRTDSGVHANMFCVSVRTQSRIPCQSWCARSTSSSRTTSR